MVKKLYIGYIENERVVFINGRGRRDSTKDVVFKDWSQHIGAVVGYLTQNYKGRKSQVDIELPDELYTQLEKLVQKQDSLRKMNLEKIQYTSIYSSKINTQV